MADDAHKMAQEIIEMLPLFYHDAQQGREDKLMDGDEVETIAARLRPLLAERDRLRALPLDDIAGMLEEGRDAIHASYRGSGLGRPDLIEYDEAIRAIYNVLALPVPPFTTHATAGQPQSEGGEGSVAPGPVMQAPPSPAVATEPINPQET